jgi:hypothetical protein
LPHWIAFLGPLKVAMWFRAVGLTSIHCWLITSASAVLSSPINYLLSFEYRTALSGHENKRKIPGKCPGVSAVRPGFANGRPPSAVATSIYCVIDPFSRAP